MGDLAVAHGFHGQSASFEGGAESLMVVDPREVRNHLTCMSHQELLLPEQQREEPPRALLRDGVHRGLI